MLKRIEARRDPVLQLSTENDLVSVHYSEVLVLEEAIEELRAQVEAARAALRDLLNDDDCGRHAYAPILSVKQRTALLAAMDEAKP